MIYKGHIYQPYEETEYGDEGPENVKIWHEVKRPDGSTVNMDWSPYSTPTYPQFLLWVELGCPDRFALRDCGGPLDNKDLQALAKKWLDRFFK